MEYYETVENEDIFCNYRNERPPTYIIKGKQIINNMYNILYLRK